MSLKNTGLFALAIFTAAAAPFAVSVMIDEAYAVPDATPLSASDKHYVDEAVGTYCKAASVDEVYPKPENDVHAQSIPVVLYHRITDKDSPSHEVTRPALFRSHLEWLKKEGYETMTVAQLTDYMDGKDVKVPAKPIVITFDDGWKDNYDAARILQEFAYGATFYVISGFFDSKLYLSEDELREMASVPNFEIGSHTHSHFVKWESKIKSVPDCTMFQEVAASKKIIERVIGKPITSIAWPYGYHTAEATFVAEKVGYKSTMLVNKDAFNRPGNSALFTRRLNVDGTCPLADFQEMVKTQKLKECS